MPGFHGQRLSAVTPKPCEVDPENEKQPSDANVPKHQRVSTLGQSVKQIIGDEKHTEEKHTFIEGTQKTAPQRRCARTQRNGLGKRVWRFGSGHGWIYNLGEGF